MKGRIVPFFLGLLVCVTRVSAALVQPCTVTAANGNYFDLSPLAPSCGATSATYPVSSSDDGTFFINICSSVGSACEGQDADTGACQYANDAYLSTGSSTEYKISALTNETGVRLSYSNGNRLGCPNGTPRSTILTIVCDQNAATPSFTFLEENPECTYNFRARTKYACPTAKAPQINQGCPVNVYLVPHTHDDVGWLQTIDGYYNHLVRDIITTVVANLQAKPDRKFIYVEMAYFWRWWNDPRTTEEMRQTSVKLFNRGQLEFVIGGWVMQDEACTTYGADIDQLTLGHQFLLKNFGAKPTKGWQIDPFGASSVTPTLNKLAGFNAHVLNRITNKDMYKSSKRMQFNWQGSPSLGARSQIFTEILDGPDNAYCDWFFNFEFNQTTVDAGNVAGIADEFYSFVSQRVPHFLTNNILADWGCDFAFPNATSMFTNMDFLLQYMQKQENKTGVVVRYATLSEYFDAVAKVPNVTYPANNGDDFFPLNDGHYWTGYFTSRVQLKGVVRQGEATAHTAESLVSLSSLLIPKFDSSAVLANLTLLRLANADSQHHDGVTGTSNPNVVDMFADDTRNGVAAALSASAFILSQYVSKSQSPRLLSPLNANLLAISAGQTVPVVLYNSLGWYRTDIVTLPVNLQGLTVRDTANKTVISQTNQNFAANAAGKYNLFFQANVPPLGFQTYFIVAPKTQPPPLKLEHVSSDADTFLSNGYIDVTISSSTGRISNVTNHQAQVSVLLDQNLVAYDSGGSGAYAFSPNGPASPIARPPPTNTLQRGALLMEFHQEFDTSDQGASWAKQTIRLFTSAGNQPNVSGFFQIDFELGPLPSRREVSALFATSIKNGKTFVTDDNGFEFVLRTTNTNPIQGNYYPTVYASYIKDNAAQLSLIFERSHGASSMATGQLEVMVHRNPDNGDGLGPALTDTTTVYPATRVVVDSPAGATVATRVQPYLFNFPLTVFVGAPTPVDTWKMKYATAAQFISDALPPNVHFLSLYSIESATVFRLTHLFAVGEDPVYSKPVSVNVKSLFSSFTIASFVETTLTANQIINEQPSATVVLNPKDIRTFVIHFGGM